MYNYSLTPSPISSISLLIVGVTCGPSYWSSRGK